MQLSPLKVNNDRAAIIQMIKLCGNKKDISKIRKIHEDKGWITDDISIATSLIRSYAKCGAVKEAKDVFDQLAERDVVSWSALIAGYVDQGFGEEALTCFREMESDGVTPNAVTYISSLRACAIVGALETVRKIHCQVRRQGLLTHIGLGTTLVSAYCKCGAVKEAWEVFEELPDRDVVSWNALITGNVNQGFGHDAVSIFRQMEADRVIPDLVTYICTLKACAIVGAHDVVREIHAQVREKGLLKKDIALGNSLVNAYAKCGALKEAREVFDQLEKPDVVSWSSMIDGYAEQGFGEEALICFKEMKSYGVTPNSLTYAFILKACVVVGEVEIVEKISIEIREQGLLRKDTSLGNSLVNAFAKCGALNEAQKLFDQLEEKDVVSWSALIDGYAEQGFGEEAVTCFREMVRDGVTPDSVAYACTLKACAIVQVVDLMEEIHAQVREQGLLNKHVILGTALVNAYAKCGLLKEAREVFDQLVECDVGTWSAFIDGYAEQGFGEEALKCFRDMERDGVTPNAVTYACVLKACATVGALYVAETIHAQVREQGFMHKEIILGTALINVYTKCGSVKEAHAVFKELAERNVESWNVILSGYAQFGHVSELLGLLKRMVLEGTFPNAVTFLVLLNGCRHGVQLELGQSVFYYLIATHDMAPKPEHYACMVDLFGRAGRFHEAKCFVLDNTTTLLAFLGACCIWVNVDDGKWAFEKLLLLDQNCASSYVSMANIYAASGMMKEADELQILRVIMESREQLD